MASRRGGVRGRLELETFGHFFVGGAIDRALPGAPMTGQMYVEYWVPKVRRSPHPLVMIHGNWQTGTNFTATPDGREGWAQYFLRRGYAVYVVDQVARGRSAHFSQAHGATGPADLTRTERRFTSPRETGLWPQAKRHRQWPGSGRAGDPRFDAFYASQFPSLTDHEKTQSLNCAAAAALLDRIGPSVVLTHSQSGAFAWPLADARPRLVKAIVAVEPNGPPVYETDLKGPPDWFADTGPRKTYGLGMVPLTYDPPLRAGEALAFVRQDAADARDLVRCWLQQEPARRLVHLRKVPVLIVVAEASYHAAYDHCTAAYLSQAGVTNTLLRLEDIGLRGNGHMMMLERNSDRVAEAIAGWLADALKAARARTRKPARRATRRKR